MAMAKDPWLPVGFRLTDGTCVQSVQFQGTDWQIVSLIDGGCSLLTRDELFRKWLDDSLVEEGVFSCFEFGHERIWFASSGWDQTLRPVTEPSAIKSKSDALSFALALKATRQAGCKDGLQDAIFFEKITRLLPTHSISAETSDDFVLGYWMTGGRHISASSIRRLDQSMVWLSASQIRDVIVSAGFQPNEVVVNEVDKGGAAAISKKNLTYLKKDQAENLPAPAEFELPGRPELEKFFNEHIVDLIRNQERYRALGIDFPSAVILHGPPGCGKTYAVEQLVEFLGWPSFQVDASSIASPYIHETSKKVAEVFERAMDNAPSVLIIDEMEAFLADRDMGSGHHRVEEVSEFLRRIPEAVAHRVLIIAMTNRIDMIDPAIQRRGRFDHIVKVDFASETEVLTLMEKLVGSLPVAEDVNVAPLAKELQGRPLSDVAFVVREAARLSAKSGRADIDQASLVQALNSVPAREREGGEQKRKIGFI